MIAGIGAFLAGLFSSTKMQDTAIDAVRKLGGLDEMSAKEKSEFLIQYMETTKHQSVVRRFIAMVLVILYSLIAVVWLISGGVGYLVGYVPALEYAGSVKLFLESVVIQPFNIILSFYFVMNIAGKLKG